MVTAPLELDYSNLLAVITDIREKSGVGGKPMLSELADAIAERVKPRIKPLVWDQANGCTAFGLGINYHMCETTPGLFAMTAPFHSEIDLPKAEMQAAAQADYEARVLSALTTEGE